MVLTAALVGRAARNPLCALSIPSLTNPRGVYNTLRRQCIHQGFRASAAFSSSSRPDPTKPTKPVTILPASFQTPAAPSLQNDQPKPKSSAYLIRKLVFAFETYPQESLVSLLALEVSSMSAIFYALNATGAQFPAEFALAFALSRPLRRLRLPIEIAVAAPLAKLFPGLTELKIASLAFHALPAAVANKLSGNSIAKSGFAQKLAETIDSYGAAYMLSARFVGVTIVFSLYAGLNNGLDVSWLLEKLGVTELGSVLGTWAGAVTLASLVYPLTISSSAFLAPALARLRSILFRRS